jgi:hypothetical protein
MNFKYQTIHDQLIKKIVEDHWRFTKESWLFLDDANVSKIKDDKELLPVNKFKHIVQEISKVLEPTTGVFYVNKLAILGNYNNIYKNKQSNKGMRTLTIL